jgi:hypothetical protein
MPNYFSAVGGVLFKVGEYKLGVVYKSPLKRTHSGSVMFLILV